MAKTWKVLSWPAQKSGTISLSCPHCGNDAECPTSGQPGSLVIAAIGLGIVFDNPSHTPPENWLPTVIQCRKCRRIFDGGKDVR